MIKIKVSYSTDEEKESLIKELQRKFRILLVSKEYKKEGPYKRIHMNLLNKK